MSRSVAGSWMLGHPLDVQRGGGHWIWDLLSPLWQRVLVDPTFWAVAADGSSVVSLGRKGSRCLAPGMAEDGRDRDILFKRSCFFFSPLFFIHKPNAVPQFPDM